MRKYILIWIFFCGCLCMNAQVFDMLNSDLYRGRVKLVSEFMKRFNGEKKNPYIDPTATEIDKINLCRLFDADFILKNRADIEPKAFQFVDSVLNNNVKINYEDPDWFAKASCVATFKGKEITFDIYLNPAKRNVLDLKNETCKNREKRNVQKKIAHTTLQRNKKAVQNGLLLWFLNGEQTVFKRGSNYAALDFTSIISL